MRISRAAHILGIAILASTVAAGVSAQQVDPIKVAAGRVRFTSGSGTSLTFAGRTAVPGIDDVIPVGAKVKTGEGRLEIQTLNRNLYWFDTGTSFDFEAADPVGDRSVLFLGRGALALETARPVTIISGAGSVYFPAGGMYSIVKPDYGRTKVRIGTVSGREPEVLRQSTFFSRLWIGHHADSGLMQWVEERQASWKLTLARANLYSRVDVLPPMVADRGADGTIHWRRVTAAGPLSWLHGEIVGNTFLGFAPRMMWAQGVLPATFSTWSDWEIMLWFRIEQYTSIRWAWNVPYGWHAEWYWDPLAGFGAQFNALEPVFSAFIWPPYMWGYPDFWPGYYWFRSPFSFNPPNPLPIVLRKAGPLHRPRGFDGPSLDGTIPFSRKHPMVVGLKEPYRVRLRLLTDTGLRSPRIAARLDVRRADLERARWRAVRRTGTRQIPWTSAGEQRSGVVRRAGSTSEVRTVTRVTRGSGGNRRVGGHR